MLLEQSGLANYASTPKKNEVGLKRSDYVWNLG